MLWPAVTLLTLLLVGAINGSALAVVRLPNLISDNMVIQRDMNAPIWGWAAPGEKVTVTLDGKTAAATTGPDGKWRANLEPMTAGGPYDLQVRGENTLTVKNVLVGEVWLCSGQSNLIFTVGQNENANEIAAAADYPRIRMLVVDRDVSSKPLDDIQGIRWVECSPKTVGGFSAVGYFFGRDVHKAIDMPVGLIQSGVTDTRVEFYMSPAALKTDPDFALVYERWARWRKELRVDEDFPDIEENLHEVYQDQRPMKARWEKAVAEAKKEGKPPPPEPKYLPWRIFKNYPSGQYHAIIRPLMPYGIGGVVWYQGEGNGSEAFLYRKLFAEMIRSWRAEWGQGDFPFLFVQFPKIYPRLDWPELRESQLVTLRAVPNTGMAVTYDIDIPPKDPVHPLQKEPFGQRLALIARGMVYGQDVVYSGPLFKKAILDGATYRLTFDHTEGGLLAKGGALTGFTMAGADQRFHPATAVIDGDSVVVSCSKVPQPASVRFGWASDPRANLTNGAGLPASPFRTDDWPAVTSRDVTEYQAVPEQMEWVVSRYLTWGMIDHAERVLADWQGDPTLWAQWLARVASAYKEAGQPAEAQRTITEALQAAEKIQNAETKRQTRAVLEGALR